VRARRMDALPGRTRVLPGGHDLLPASCLRGKWLPSKIRVDTYRYGSAMTKSDRLYRLNDAARLVGVAPITLKRWLLQQKVVEVRRDRNGWRVFDDADIDRIRIYATSLHKPSRR